MLAWLRLFSVSFACCFGFIKLLWLLVLLCCVYVSLLYLVNVALVASFGVCLLVCLCFRLPLFSGCCFCCSTLLLVWLFIVYAGVVCGLSSFCLLVDLLFVLIFLLIVLVLLIDFDFADYWILLADYSG